MKKYWEYLVLFFLSIVFFINGFIFLDPDFGWHYQIGEFILQHRNAPYTDLFSYTMPSFPAVAHAWGTEVLMAALFNSSGFLGLSVVFALLLSLLFVVSYKILNSIYPHKTHIFKTTYLYVSFLVFSLFTPFFGIRTQVVGWVLFNLIFYILYFRKKSLRFLIPFIILVWANLHGSFLSGIVLYFLFILGIFLRTKKIDKKDVFLLILSLTATFINPYGISLWREVLQTLFGSGLRENILEWMPLWATVNLPLLFYIVFSCVLVFLVRQKIRIELSIVFVFFLIQSLASARYVPFFLCVSLPVTIEAIYLFSLVVPKDKESKKRIKKATIGFIIITLLMTVFELVNGIQSKFKYSETVFYPLSAVQFLEKNTIKGNLFSEYGWGGYLIWKYPSKKIYMSGQMPVWRWKAPDSRESNNVMEEYNSIIYQDNQDWERLFEKYSINTVLWPANENKQPRAKIYTSLEKNLCKMLSTFGCRVVEKSLPSRLIENGWKEVYRDSTAVIYNRPNE